VLSLRLFAKQTKMEVLAISSAVRGFHVAGLQKINSKFKRMRHITNALFCYSFVIQ